MVDGPGHVYVLELAEGRFYVGHTTDLYRRICQHFSGTGAVFTKTFKPLKVLSVTEGSVALEKATFAATAATHGFDNVRGAGYTKVQMKAPTWYLQAKDFEAWRASEACSEAKRPQASLPPPHSDSDLPTAGSLASAEECERPGAKGSVREKDVRSSG